MNPSPFQPAPRDFEQVIPTPLAADDSPWQDDEPLPRLPIFDVPDYEPPERPQITGPLCLANLRSYAVDWLWPGRIPIGKVTLLVGEPGLGKSLVALDVAARLTTGAPWPDSAEWGRANGEWGSRAANTDQNISTPNSPFPIPHAPLVPSSVLLLSAEDDLADTIRPRLDALGADCSRIIAVPAGWSPEDPKSLFGGDIRIPDRRPLAERPAPPRPFDLAHDVGYLNTLLLRRPDCRLMIIDPLSAYLGPGIENVNSEVRRLLTALAKLADRRRVAIIAVNHLRKQQGTALHRAMGSLALVAAARTAWLVAPDPADPARRLLLPMKNNLAARGFALSYTIEPTTPNSPPIIRWSETPLTITADEALRPPKLPAGRPSDERDDAIQWLQQALAEGAKPSAQIEERAVAHGFRLHTLRRAFRELHGEAVRIGFGPLGQWYWRLPGIGEQNPQPTFEELYGFEPEHSAVPRAKP